MAKNGGDHDGEPPGGVSGGDDGLAEQASEVAGGDDGAGAFEHVEEEADQADPPRPTS